VEHRLTLSTYYVSPTGSDNAAGALQAPWATLQHAANTVGPGDTVDVEPGDYTGFNIVTSGTATAPITFDAQPGAVINTPMVWGGITFGINASGPSYNIIDGFTVTPQSGQASWDAGIRMGGIWPGGSTPGWADGNVIENNVAAMRVVANGDTSETGDTFPIFTSWQNGLVVSGNTASGGWDSGIYVSNSSTSYTVSGNTVFNVGGNGIHNNGDASQGGPGINTNAVIEDNIIHDVGFGIGGQAISCDGVQDSTIANNLIYNAYAKGISLYLVDASTGSQNDLVENNTVLTNSSGGAAMRIVDDSTGNTLLNNIFYTANPTSASIDIESGDTQGLTSNYNLLTGLIYVDGSSMTLSEWKSYGYDQRSFIATPSQLFVNPSGNDYQELSTSPSNGAGTATHSPTLDILGNPRPSVYGWDIGCYEYEGSFLTVRSESPASGATDVGLSTPLTASFNEGVQSSTIGVMLASGSGTSVAGTLLYNPTNVTATFIPSTPLAYDTRYTATVSGAESSSGTHMSAAYSWSFTTDPEAPAVTTETPAIGATSVSISTTVSATFDEAVRSGTIDLSLLSSSGTSSLATATYNSSNDTVTLTPIAALQPFTRYTATVSGALDAASDPMAAPFTWSFTTGATGPPAVTIETPSPGATDTAISATVTATFNQAVQSNTITFTLEGPSGSSVGASVSYNSSTDTATLIPNAPLAYETTYTATVDEVENGAGAAMTAPFDWCFTTLSISEVPPVVITAVQAELNRRHELTKVVLTYSGPLDAIEAQNPAIYRLITAGKHGSFTARTAKTVRPRSAVYDVALDQVTVALKKPIAFSKPVELEVSCQPPSGLRDSFGRYLYGGTDAAAVLSRGQTRIDSRALSQGQ
jgi:parallel beta-helix repeat protein